MIKEYKEKEENKSRKNKGVQNLLLFSISIFCNKFPMHVAYV